MLWWKRSTDNEPKIHTPKEKQRQREKQHSIPIRTEPSRSSGAHEQTALYFPLTLSLSLFSLCLRLRVSHIFLFYFGENAIIKIIVFTTLYQTVTNTFYSLLHVFIFCCCFFFSISAVAFLLAAIFFLYIFQFRSIYLFIFTFVRSVLVVDFECYRLCARAQTSNRILLLKMWK